MVVTSDSNPRLFPNWAYLHNELFNTGLLLSLFQGIQPLPRPALAGNYGPSYNKNKRIGANIKQESSCGLPAGHKSKPSCCPC